MYDQIRRAGSRPVNSKELGPLVKSKEETSYGVEYKKQTNKTTGSVTVTNNGKYTKTETSGEQVVKVRGVPVRAKVTVSTGGNKNETSVQVSNDGSTRAQVKVGAGYDSETQRSSVNVSGQINEPNGSSIQGSGYIQISTPRQHPDR